MNFILPQSFALMKNVIHISTNYAQAIFREFLQRLYDTGLIAFSLSLCVLLQHKRCRSEVKLPTHIFLRSVVAVLDGDFIEFANSATVTVIVPGGHSSSLLLLLLLVSCSLTFATSVLSDCYYNFYYDIRFYLFDSTRTLKATIYETLYIALLLIYILFPFTVCYICSYIFVKKYIPYISLLKKYKLPKAYSIATEYYNILL